MRALILLVFLSVVSASVVAVEPHRIISDYQKVLDQPFHLLLYKGSYWLPVSYNDSPNQALIDD